MSEHAKVIRSALAAGARTAAPGADGRHLALERRPDAGVELGRRSLLNARPGLALQKNSTVRLKQRRVTPTPRPKATAINDDAGLEREADRMGALALAGASGNAASPARAAPHPGAPVQRKVRVAATGQEYVAVSAAKAAGKAEVQASEAYPWEGLETGIVSAKVYTVKTLADLILLAETKQADVLQPAKHIIGESHHLSQFNAVKAGWPGVMAVEEGQHSLLETGLAMTKDSDPSKPASSTVNFQKAMQSKGSKELPLENYHAASLARLTSYLVVWNVYESAPNTPNVEHYVVSRAKEIVKIWDTYGSVSASVFTAGIDASWFGFSPSYAGKIEEAYGRMYELIKTPSSKSVRDKMEAVGASQGAPKISAKEVVAVRAWIVDMVDAVGDIMTVSAAKHKAAGEIGKEMATARAAVKKAPGMKDMDAALGLVNPTRERFMAEHIGGAPVPSLIKVGKAHLPGLAKYNIANAAPYEDVSDFTAALKAKADDLKG